MCAAHVFTFRVDSDRQVCRLSPGLDLVRTWLIKSWARIACQTRRNGDNVVNVGIYDLSTGQVNGLKKVRGQVSDADT
jgi:hypothetical protein